jgi:DNA polymerase
MGDVIYYPMYHPAAALHQGRLRQLIEADMLKIPQLLAQFAKGKFHSDLPEGQKLNGVSTEVKQLTLF